MDEKGSKRWEKVERRWDMDRQKVRGRERADGGRNKQKKRRMQRKRRKADGMGKVHFGSLKETP